MNPTQRTYIAIDLKSFFASVECVERGLDPLTTNLVVADASRTEKTICLAVTPSLKAHGVGGRARLFEVVQRVREVNRQQFFTPSIRQVLRCPGAGTASRLGGGLHRGSAPDGLLHRIQPADL